MTPEQRQEQEIERNERWLRENVPDIGDVDTERIKARVRIAVHEQRLEEQLCDDPQAVVAGQDKLGVLAVFSRGRSQSRDKIAHGTSIRRIPGWVGGSGLAAAACLALWAGFYWLHTGRRDVGSNQGPPELVLVTAFEQFAEDDLSQSLALLADDVSEMEQMFDEIVFTDTDGTDYDDLLDAIEEAQWDETTENDWS